MPPGPAVAVVLAVTTSVAWSIALVVRGEPPATGTATIIALSLIIFAVVAASGLLLARGRWSLWLITALAAGWIAVAGAVDAAPIWLVATIAAAVAASAVAFRGGKGWTRRLPSAQGPPPIAVWFLLGSLGFPALVAAANWSEISAAAIVGAVTVSLGGALYARGGVWGLLATRALVPGGVITSVVATPLPQTIMVAAAGAGLAIVTWLPAIRRAAAPLLIVPGTGYRIPPELAPPEILDAAGLDEKGRRR